MSHRPPQAHTRDPVAALRGSHALGSLPERTLRRLGKYAKWVTLEPGGLLSTHAAKQEHYYFVHEGQLVVALLEEAPAGGDRLAIGAKLDQDRDYLAYLGDRGMVSDAYTSIASGPDGERLDCLAVVASVLVGLPKNVLAEAMRAHPHWAQELAQRHERQWAAYGWQKLPLKRVAQDFFVRKGYSYSRTLKVIDLDRCIDCGACEDSCAARHGAARLVRGGMALGRLSFPSACRSCVDHRCLDACGFNAMSLTDAGEVLINHRTCAGCSACQSACPNGVIEMVEVPYTVADFPKPLPLVDGEGLSNLPGLYVAGEATGTALIKLAINAGRTAADHVASRLANHAAAGRNGTLDTIVVGAGPAGLSAALACKERNLRFKVFDKGHFATTIQDYPKHKVVMAEPAHIPLFGKLWLKNTTKEELIDRWRDIIAKTGLRIESNEEVIAVKPTAEHNFDVQTSKGRYQAHTVIVCVGTRGTPRKLGVEGEASPRVQYVLTDPEAFAGQDVLVVGGGDSAVEAAMSLADVPKTKVTISYRQESFGRIKTGNQTRIKEYADQGRLEVIFQSSVLALDAGTVTLKTAAGKRRLKNDVAFAMLGAEPPTRFLKDMGVEIAEPNTKEMARFAASRGMRKYANKCDHCHGHEDKACLTACPTHALLDVEPQSVFSLAQNEGPAFLHTEPFLQGFDAPQFARRSSRLARLVAFLAVGVALAMGAEVVLRTVRPELSGTALFLRYLGRPSAVTFTPGGGLGHILGYAGTGLMVFAALYAFRLRTRRNGLGGKQIWLWLHILSGILGPAFVTYHSALKLDRWPTLALAAAWLVVLSGALGRYVSTWATTSASLADYELKTFHATRERLFADWKGIEGRTRLFEADAKWLEAKPVSKWQAALLPLLIAGHQTATLGRYTWLRLFGLRRVHDRRLKRQTLATFVEGRRTVLRKMFIDGVKTSVTAWRIFHLVLTLLMLAIAATHVVVALMYKAS